MSLSTGKKIDTVVKDQAPPFGDVVSASQIQDNSYDPGLWDKAGVFDNGHTHSGAQRLTDEPSAPGFDQVPPNAYARPAGKNLAHDLNEAKFSDGTPTWLS